MRNQHFSDGRRSWRSVELDEDAAKMIPEAPSAHSALELKEVLAAMSLIPPEMAEAIMMIAEGLTYEEAAEESGVEAGTVKSRASRGRAMLEKLFEA